MSKQEMGLSGDLETPEQKNEEREEFDQEAFYKLSGQKQTKEDQKEADKLAFYKYCDSVKNLGKELKEPFDSEQKIEILKIAVGEAIHKYYSFVNSATRGEPSRVFDNQYIIKRALERAGINTVDLEISVDERGLHTSNSNFNPHREVTNTYYTDVKIDYKGSSIFNESFQNESWEV